MALVDVLFKTRVRIGVGASEELLPSGAIELDASITETHTAANEITKFPVEEGVDITDHVRRQPDRVSIRGIVTDHPIWGIGRGPGAIQPGLASSRSLDAHAKLLTMVDEAKLVSVVTSLKQYENMVIESMKVPRTVKLGQAVEVALELREIKIAQVGVTAGTSDLGTQNPTEVS